jgi:hypothetical protein
MNDAGSGAGGLRFVGPAAERFGDRKLAVVVVVCYADGDTKRRKKPRR